MVVRITAVRPPTVRMSSMVSRSHSTVVALCCASSTVCSGSRSTRPASVRGLLSMVCPFSRRFHSSMPISSMLGLGAFAHAAVVRQLALRWRCEVFSGGVLHCAVAAQLEQDLLGRGSAAEPAWSGGPVLLRPRRRSDRRGPVESMPRQRSSKPGGRTDTRMSAWASARSVGEAPTWATWRRPDAYFGGQAARVSADLPGCQSILVRMVRAVHPILTSAQRTRNSRLTMDLLSEPQPH